MTDPPSSSRRRPGPKKASRIYDPADGSTSVRLQPGDFYVTGVADERIVTILGSCVAACIRNPETGFGGMNHFMLPHSEGGDWSGVNAQLRFGNFAMDALIEEVLKPGGRLEALEVKLFGGANMFVSQADVGAQNAKFACDYLKQRGLKVLAADLGGNHGRRVLYSPATGKVRRLLLTRSQEHALIDFETLYSATFAAKPETLTG